MENRRSGNSPTDSGQVSEPSPRVFKSFESRLNLFRTFGGLDEFPEFGVFLQGLVFAHLDAGTVKEILEGVPAHNAMHEHAEGVTFKIHAVIADAKTMQGVAAAFQLAKILEFAGDDVLRQPAKIAENLQLQFLGHARQFCRAGRRKDDLKGAHQDRGVTLSHHRRSPQC